MIPVDIDNFIVYTVANYWLYGSIYIKNADVIPKELSNCSSLATLYLSDNKIIDISALSNCLYLTTLHLSNNQIVDISPLSNCSSLTTLYIGNNKIIDISPIIKCKNLIYLYAQNNNIKSKITFSSHIYVQY